MPFTAQSNVLNSPPQTPKLPPRTGARAFIALREPMRRSPYGELLLQGQLTYTVCRCGRAPVTYRKPFTPCHTAPPMACKRLPLRLRISHSRRPAIDKTTYAHTKGTTKVTESDPWAGVTAVIHGHRGVSWSAKVKHLSFDVWDARSSGVNSSNACRDERDPRSRFTRSPRDT